MRTKAHPFTLFMPRFMAAVVLSTMVFSVAFAKDAGDSKFVTFEGGRVHYVNYGKGSDALILIHGWTQSVDAWRDQIPDLSKRNRVIAVDLPGHGQSDKPQAAYTMEYFARAIEAVMRDAKVKRAVLVGHSMGTPIARQFYRKYPDKTLGIVIVDGALKPFGDKAMMDRMIAGLRAPNYKDTINQMFTAMTASASPEVKTRINSAAATAPQHVVVSAMEGMADMSIWGDDKINVPVLAIMAKNPFFPPNLDVYYKELAPNLEFYMWEGVDHFLMMEKAKEFNAGVIAFLDKNKLLK